MLGKALLNLFRGGQPPAIAQAESGLTASDREAILADLAPADATEAGLGEKLATFVIAGQDAVAGAGEALLLHLDTLMQPGQGKPGQATLDEALLPSPHAWDQDKAELARKERRLKTRHQVLWALQGFDAAAMRRYGQVLGRVHAARSHRYGFPGSDRSPMWLRALLSAVFTYGRSRTHDRTNTRGTHGILTVPRIQEMLALDGLSIAPLVDCLFVDGAEHYQSHTGATLALDGMAAALASQPDAVAGALGSMPAATRARMAEYFARAGLLDTVPAFFELTFALAGTGSKAARSMALTALAAASASRVRARAAAALESRSADDRLAAVHVLAARGAGELPALAAHEAREGSKKVLQAIATARATLEAPQASAAEDGPEDGAEGYTGMDGRWVPVPPWTPGADTCPADVGDAFRDMMQAANRMARRGYDAASAEDRADRSFPKEFIQPFDLATAKELQGVASGKLRPAKAHAAVRYAADASVGHHKHLQEARANAQRTAAAILDRPDVSLAALVRLRLAGETQATWQGWRGLARDMVMRSLGPGTLNGAISRRLKAGADLRELAAVAEAEGLATGPALAEAVGNLWARTIDDDDVPEVWPLLAAHLPVLDAALKPSTSRHSTATSVVALLGDFPVVPRRYFPQLIDRAATGTPQVRNQARALLRDAGDLTPIIATMLRDGDAARRTGGARWLRERRDPAAVPPLRAALDKERNLAARAALLAALAACGDDISAEFSEDRMLAEAEAGLPKTKADYKDLFDADALPVLRWADGREVPPKVVQWWFARAHKLRQPGGDPLLHMALDRLDRRDAERLGQAVLTAFIQFDTRKVSLADANAYAQQHAPGRHQMYLRWNKDYTEEQAFAEIRREKLGEYLGSALDHQGLLALARFAVPADAVAMVKRYLRDHGKRASQCRALLDALAADPVPAVLQLILATSQRHKQPGTRKYAGELANALAEDRGWTAAELADRTIPTAGLDDDGVLDLPIGERTYRARAAAARGKAAKDVLALVLENPEGKPVGALPTPSDPAEAEEAKAAKKALANAKKELKQTVESQTGRLYAAMCSDRVWPTMDFEAFLLRHPVVGPLLRRLVLLGLDAEGRAAASFRALDDGTFSDAADGPVGLAGFAGIGIAHRVTLGADAAAAWATHLADYEVAPLFEQLDRPVLTAADAGAKAVTDRVGWMIDSTTLRTAATALGYQRGSIEDGGCFYGYERHLPDLGLAAVVGFTGSYVPETERRTGALRDLTFVRLRDGKTSWGSNGIPLGKVPPVLLSEAWNDLHAIAAQGTGYDADWEKKAQW